MWHTFIKSVCNGTIPGIGRFINRSLIPGLNNGTIKALCDIDPNYSPCKSIFEFLYNGNETGVSNYTFKDALENINGIMETVAVYGKVNIYIQTYEQETD
jgi:hypothetical protein